MNEPVLQLDSSWNGDIFEVDKYIFQLRDIDTFKIEYQGSGWYEVEGGGWLYINEVNSICYVYSWTFDPRSLFRNILEAEVR